MVALFILEALSSDSTAAAKAVVLLEEVLSSAEAQLWVINEALLFSVEPQGLFFSELPASVIASDLTNTDHDVNLLFSEMQRFVGVSAAKSAIIWCRGWRSVERREEQSDFVGRVVICCANGCLAGTLQLR